MKRDTEETAVSGRARPFVWLFVACALAYLWSLGSVFYMDDFTQIRDNEFVRSGRFWEKRLSGWTYLGYFLQYRLFGMSAVGFHAVNWLLHTAVVCVLFGFGRDFLKGRCPAGVAWFGACLFAVHPLASEIPNYVRTQDLAWVTLFSLLAAWAMLRFLRDGGWLMLGGCAAGLAGATFSKGPGLFHALMAVGVVGLAVMERRHWDALRRNALRVAAAGVMALAVLWATGALDRWLLGMKMWAEPRFIGHAYTVSRVFWEFAWRAVVPVSLSSDHLVAETLIPAGSSFLNIPDRGAMVAAGAFLALAVFSGFLAWRKPTRLAGVCLFLFVTTMLFRVLYPISEFMPEYRIYPGLPWFSLGAAVVLAGGWKWLFPTVSARVPAVILLAAFTVLSARRSFVWHDLDTLMADVLKRYPARARAVWELDERDVAVENWRAVIDRHAQVWPDVERHFVTGNQRLAPARELPSGDFVLALVAHMGCYARAVAHTQGPAAGLRVMAQLEAHMQLMRMEPKKKPLEWAYFHHAKGLILELAGNHEAAAASLRQKGMPPAWRADLERVERKLAGAKPGS